MPPTTTHNETAAASISILDKISNAVIMPPNQSNNQSNNLSSGGVALPYEKSSLKTGGTLATAPGKPLLVTVGSTDTTTSSSSSVGSAKNENNNKTATALLSQPELSPKTKAEVLGKPLEVLIPFNKPCLFPECTQAIQQAFSMGKLSGDGLNSKHCTDWFANRFGYTNSLLTPSCTAALEMAALLLQLKPGDEVICPSFTFVSSASAFALRGVTLVFGDSEPDHPNMSVDDVLSKITPKTKAIVVVHYAGVPMDVHRLAEMGIPIVEDCAHAIGTIDPKTNDYIGKTSCLATFSFHETKNIGIGEGGLLVVNDEKLWEQAQIIREKGTNRTAFRQGRDSFYTWLSLGSSYLMSDVDAGVLWGCLQHYDAIQSKRLAVWDYYHDHLWHNNAAFIKPQHDSRANAHMYFVKFPNEATAKEFQAHMKSRGVLVTSHYRPLDQSPFVVAQNEKANFQTPPKPCEQAEIWSRTLIRLPLFFGLHDKDLETIVDTVNDFSSHSQIEGMTLRPATPEFLEAIRVIRNQHRHCFGNPEEIDAATHASFMAKHASTYRVAVDNVTNQVIGFIGQVAGDVRLATDASAMRRGVAKFMWQGLVHAYPNVTVKVLRDNAASLGFFQKLGWKPNPTEWEDGTTDPVNLVAPSAFVGVDDSRRQ